MTKRFDYFQSEITDLYVIEDKTSEYSFQGIDDEDIVSKIVDLLNKQDEEIKRLKTDNKGYRSNYEIIKGTPVLFINGVPYISILEMHKQLKRVIEKEDTIKHAGLM